MKRTLWFAAALLPVLAACAALGPMLPPWLEDNILFPHQKHIAAEVDCLACHETVYDAKDLEARHMPAEDTCMECHSDWKDEGRCQVCHSNVRVARKWQERKPELNFNHVNHLERTEEDCSKCHKVLPERHKAGTPVAMDACLECHEHREQYQAGRCDSCHKDIQEERLQPRKDFSHQGNFVKLHRTAARNSSDSCMVCHTQPQCVQCHNATPAVRIEVTQPAAVARNFIHRNDFISRHNLEAQADPALCYRCHSTDTCVSCHRQQNLTPDGRDPRSPHPTHYVQRGGRAFHGQEARQDIQRCAACHDQGQRSNCVSCHQSGGVGGNPHPPSWAMDHNQGEISTNGMCQYCHR